MIMTAKQNTQYFRYSALAGALIFGFSEQSGAVSGYDFDIELSSNYSGISVIGDYNKITILATPLPMMIANGVSNYGNVTSLINNAEFTSERQGVINEGAIGIFINNGVMISASDNLISNAFSATIDSFINNGTLAASDEDSYVIVSNGSLGKLTNAGIISGDIYSTYGLNIVGGEGITIGQITGYASGNSYTVGQLRVGDGGLIFSAGNTRLNDNVDLAGGYETMSNKGANLYIANSINVHGNYYQAAAASLKIEVSPSDVLRGIGTLAARSGTLYVSGSTLIDPGSSINLVSHGYAFAPGQRYVVINSANGAATNYNENTLNYSADNYAGRLSGIAVPDAEGHKSLVVTLTGTPSLIMPSIPAAASSISGLMQYQGVSSSALLAVQNSVLALRSLQDANKAGMQLSAITQMNTMIAGAQSMNAQMNEAMSRLQSLMKGITSASSALGFSGGDDPAEHSVWGQTFGGRINQGSTSEVSGYHANYAGIVIGADTDITENWRGGGALSYTGTSVHGDGYTHGSSSDIDSYGLTLYAGYTAPTWYSNLYLGAASQRYHTLRHIAFTGFSGDASGRFSGEQYIATMEAGYPIAVTPALAFTPMVSLSYSYQSQDGYTESGGNGAALKVDNSHNDATISGLGAKLDGIITTRIGDLNPYLQVMWYHQYDSKPARTSAGFAAASDETGFTSRGSSPAKDVANINVGMSLIHTRDTELTAYYDISAASRYSNQSVGLSFKKWF